MVGRDGRTDRRSGLGRGTILTLSRIPGETSVTKRKTERDEDEVECGMFKSSYAGPGSQNPSKATTT